VLTAAAAVYVSTPHGQDVVSVNSVSPVVRPVRGSFQAANVWTKSRDSPTARQVITVRTVITPRTHKHTSTHHASKTTLARRAVGGDLINNHRRRICRAVRPFVMRRRSEIRNHPPDAAASRRERRAASRVVHPRLRTRHPICWLCGASVSAHTRSRRLSIRTRITNTETGECEYLLRHRRRGYT